MNESAEEAPQKKTYDPFHAVFVGSLYVVLEVNCDETPFPQLSVWLVLPPYNRDDDHQEVGQRIIGPVDAAIAEAVAKNLHFAFQRAGCDVHTINTADD